MDFSIIIPNFNGEKFLPQCLRSLKTATDYCPKSRFEVILVDNASTDQSRATFLKYFPSTWIQLSSNTGFGAAVNAGVKKAKSPYVVVLNNDLFVSPSWFLHLNKAIKKFPQAACFYGLVLNKDGSKIESEGFRFHPSLSAQNINNGKKYKKSKIKNKKYRKIWGAPASLIVYRRDVFQKLHGFDSRFFAYIEDVDLSYRLISHHYHTIYIPQAISRHLGGATSNRMGNLRAKLSFRNWLFFLKKNYTTRQTLRYFPGIFIQRLKDFRYFLSSTPISLWLPEIRQIYLSLLEFDQNL